jgi:ferredoxin
MEKESNVIIHVDMNKCQHYGQCVYEAPANFKMNDKDKLEYTAVFADQDLEKVQAAIDVCPMQAISLRTE